MTRLTNPFQIGRWSLPILLVPVCLVAQDAAPAPAQPKIDWQHGPILAKLGTQAQVQVPEGYLFADRTETRKFLELTQNIPNGSELGVVANPQDEWFVVFEFDDVGYVKDDEKNSLDADAILKSIQTATEKSNEQRRARGWGTLTVLDWLQPPHYDPSTHNLEWSTRVKDDKGNLVSNLNTRYLGRRGVMRVSLVADSTKLAPTMTGFRSLMGGFGYTPDNNYRAFVKGDRMAEYGLTALVVGGTAAVLAKTGILKYLWKFIVVGILALGGLLKKLFSKAKPVPPPQPQPDPIQPQ